VYIRGLHFILLFLEFQWDSNGEIIAIGKKISFYFLQMPGNVPFFELMHLKFEKSANTTQTLFFRTKSMGYQTTLNLC
jgi:hypothetical protein